MSKRCLKIFLAMESVRAVVYLSVCLSVLTSLCQGQRSADGQLPSAPEEPFIGLTTKELAAALQGVLDEADSSVSVQKKASVIPRCDVGERCAMKHGPRIGRLCDCLRGTACNTFFLRCY
ncbi:cocaine- and amphetamine-regulated transcript 4 isoform X2 [Siniperca chuatsi]|uniref:cocaine- and amphetamine-regulated transcript 4 isoform X2 n=1 Tax=Siniperca chuatsi TaxID=119488 RepID=UPI001CE09C93|nr:cocaine- and amphetamine-regulated transcript 4 isoform X2 [Siniperca chuatsi]XP_044028092.1 cocaine- and amphetamine-regulated transcript 4 isoform X2 [Siniperca chuatsi]